MHFDCPALPVSPWCSLNVRIDPDGLDLPFRAGFTPQLPQGAIAASLATQLKIPFPHVDCGIRVAGLNIVYGFTDVSFSASDVYQGKHWTMKRPLSLPFAITPDSLLFELAIGYQDVQQHFYMNKHQMGWVILPKQHGCK